MDMDLDGKENAEHFNPHAANYITNSSQSLLNPYGMPSEVQVLSDAASFNLHDSPGGSLMTIIPNWHMKKLGLIESLRNMPKVILQLGDGKRTQSWTAKPMLLKWL